jgi:hypothetical protein
MHSLVAEAFLGPRPRGWCVNHKNGVRDDNRIANLQWTTYSANNMATRRIRCPLMRKQAGNGKRRIDEVQRNKHARGEAHGMAKLTNEQVLAVHSLSAVGWLNKEISAELGIRCLSVNDILAGRTWRHLHPDPQKRL